MKKGSIRIFFNYSEKIVPLAKVIIFPLASNPIKSFPESPPIKTLTWPSGGFSVGTDKEIKFNNFLKVKANLAILTITFCYTLIIFINCNFSKFFVFFQKNNYFKNINIKMLIRKIYI